MSIYIKKYPPVIGTKLQCSFVPDETIHCVPPYIKGKLDGGWHSVIKVDPTNKTQCEKALGIKLQPLPKN